MRLIRRNLNHYVNKLENRESFGLARYGDGEWLTILGYYGRKNSNGCTFTRALSKDLGRVIREEYAYDYSTLRIARNKLEDKIDAWLKEHNVNIEWILGDFLLRASIDGKMYPLIEQLRKRKILYVGPQHCRQLRSEFFDYVAFIQPPPIDAHAEKWEIEQNIFHELDTKDIDFIGISSGLAGKVFIGDIWGHTDGEVPIMDFGSLWDGYFDVPSRSYIRRGNVNFPEVKKQNLQKVLV